MSADYPEFAIPDEDAPAPPPPRRSVMDWLPVLVTAPFLVLFLATVMPRLGVPFELEWNEGQAGEQAWRFAHGMALYPSPEQNWVPYMYAPLYHMVWGAVMKLTDVHTLGLGRMISFLASIATAMGVFMIVWDRARRAVPPLFAAFLYFAFFKPSGYWYDLARVDSLAFALCVWGMYLTLKERVAAWEGVLGLVVLLLGTLTKQTVAPVALYCGAAMIFKSPRALLFGGVLVALLSANFLIWFQRDGNDEFIKYAYTNALKHIARPAVYFPKAQHPTEFMAEVPEPKGTVQVVGHYLHNWRTFGAPDVWRECGRHVWILLAIITLWVVAALCRRRLPNGWVYIPPSLALALGGMEGYAKFGGFMNNFLPLFVCVAMLAGLALAELRATLGASRPALFGGLFGAALLLQLLQPWGVPKVSNDASNYELLRRIYDQPRRQQVMDYARGLSDDEKARQAGAPTPPGLAISEGVPFATKLAYHLRRFLAPGLAFFPADQWPAESSQRAYESLMHFLVRKREQGEAVLIVHHQWYGIISGHPMALNADMVRCAQWAGDPVPPQMGAVASSGVYTWMIVNSPVLQYDWIPEELRRPLDENYEQFGPIPFLDTLMAEGALVPLTGAEQRPSVAYRLRGSDSQILDGKVFEMGGMATPAPTATDAAQTP
ncbi:hypothetical protein IT571_03275 [Candidatus Sumerlaeota bacterium]|nr:hypothetical protein [Candidatus Sumerlaeota bacterium]